MKKLNSTNYKTTQWSGGETTELFIFPEESDFKERDFLYRLSIATIQVSSSDFTPLPNINRTLLLLEGELKLIHENHHESFLMPFSQDSFQGGWKTHSIGIAKDFNLMTRQGCSGTIEVITNKVSMDYDCDHLLIYNFDGNCNINEASLLQNELIVFSEKPSDSISIDTDGHIVVVKIKFE